MSGESEPVIVHEVSLVTIIRDDSLQGRMALHPPAIKQYTNVLKSGGNLVPVELGRIGTRLYLLDGWHRVAAAEEVKAIRVRAVIRDFANLRALSLAAVAANTTHGVQLKTRDHRRRLDLFIGTKGHRKAGGGLMSYREIAAALGGAVAYTTVRNWIMKHHPRVAAQMVEPPREASKTWEWSPPERRALREQVARTSRTILAAVEALYRLDEAAACDELQGTLDMLGKVLEDMKAGRPFHATQGAPEVVQTDGESPGLIPPPEANDDF